MTTLNPYLHFGDNCEAAFAFYHGVFGGEAPRISRFNEMPNAENMSANEGELVMHAELSIGQGSVLMGSDRPAAMGENIVGNNFAVSIHPESEEEAKRLFDGLAAGGKVMMPLNQTYWGATFGMLTDKFGVQWMVHLQQ